MNDSEILVKVENVSKKFCRSLKKSLWYGVQDIARDLNPFTRNSENGKQTAEDKIESRRQKAEINSAEGQNQFQLSALSDDKFQLSKFPISALPEQTFPISALRKSEFWAVNDVSFELRRGECLGLIGHNGAGKTTLLKILNGLIKPDGGRITMRGRIGALIALGAGFNPILSGRENIYVNGSVLGMTKKEIDGKIGEIIDFAEIGEFIDAPVQGYSSGMAVRLGFAIAVKCQPDILLLDEVLAVGDVGFQAKCFNTLSEFRKSGTAFILVSHNMHQISRYCDQVLYLKQGRVVQLGSPEAGIEHFLKDMHTTDTDAKSEMTDWSKVYGSGKVILRKATFLSETGEVIQKIKTGDAFTLAIDYECPGEDVDDAILDIAIRDKEGTLFQGTSKNFGVDFGRLARHGRFLVAFQDMPANVPEVKFFLALVSGRSREMYDWKRHLKLSIENNPMLTGRIALDVSWASQSARTELV
jgi:lipopolysaccharide transport system ATP-binding protein